MGHGKERCEGEMTNLEAVKLGLEAAAKVAAGHFIYGHSVAGPHFASACADKILKLDSAAILAAADAARAQEKIEAQATMPIREGAGPWVK